MEQKPNQNQQANSNEINLFDVLIILARRKVFIFTTVFSITVAALIISLVIPETYKSTATILPPTGQSSSIGGALGGLVGNVMQLSFGADRISSEAVLTVLNSRSIKEEVIDRFDLFDVYDVDFIEHAIKQLSQNTEIREVREGGFGFNPVVAVEVSVTDREPQRARDMAAFYLSKADSVVNVMNTQNARESLAIIEARYLQNLREMEAAENALSEFQSEFGILEIEEQTRAIIDQVAILQSNLTEMEIQVEIARQSLSDNQPELRSMIRARDEIRRRLDALLRSEGQEVGFSLFPPVDQLPTLGLEYLRLYREVVVQNKVYEGLYPQYVHQQMTVEDQRRNIQIVDPASLPTYKDAPKRALIVLAGLVFAVFLSLIIVFLQEMIARGKEQDSDNYRKYLEFKQALSFRSGK